ncbi:MAG TPA: GTPase [Burkholderiaceae bacterium]
MTTRLALVTGRTAASREAAIAERVNPQVSSAFILEGLSSGSGKLETLAEDAGFPLIRVAPACMCCTGNLTLRVHLNRILRHPPEALFVSVANDAHIAQLRAFLSAPPYANLLSLQPNLQAAE